MKSFFDGFSRSEPEDRPETTTVEKEKTAKYRREYKTYMVDVTYTDGKEERFDDVDMLRKDNFLRLQKLHPYINEQLARAQSLGRSGNPIKFDREQIASIPYRNCKKWAIVKTLNNEYSDTYTCTVHEDVPVDEA